MPTSKDLTDLDSQLKKTLISAESFKRGSSFDISKSITNIHKTVGTLAGHTRKLVVRFNDLEKTVNNNSRKITSLKNVSKTQSQRISGTNIGAKLPGSTTSNVEDNISAIAASVNSIAEILAGRKKAADDAAAYDRKKAEQEKRGLAESKLEKVIGGIAKTAEKVIAPVKSLLDRIFDFIGKIILGRILYLILGWFGDKKNADKVKSLIRFFTDWGPTLLSLYIVFGTSFGKFARGLISFVIKSTVRLGAAVTALAVKAGIGKAGGKLSKVAGFLGGRKGKLLAAGLEAGVTVAGTLALSNTLKGDGGEQQPKAQGFAGGGYVRPRFPAFSGGGFNFKGMLGGAGMGAAFGPLGMLLGGAFGSGKPQEMMSGFVSGEKGVDKVPAMLSDGEFVMSVGAVEKYGVDTLEAMNAAGGGTNKPKIMGGKTYAAGGGLIGDKDTKGFKRESDGLYSGGLIADRKEDLAQQEVVARLKRIEKQLQVQTALASGKGLDIKGASYGANLGKGFATTFQGRDAIVIKNGVDYDTYSTGVADSEITLGGKRYFAVKRGKDLIYVSNFAKGLAGQVDKYGAKNKSYKGTGGGVMSGLSDKDKKSLPKTKIMMGPDGPFVGYLTYKNGEPSYQRPTQRKKGMLESLADFFDPKGAKSRQETLNARSLRLTAVSDLEDYRRRGMKEENIKKMLTERLGANGYSRAVNDLKAKKTRIISEEKMKKISDSSSIATGNTNIGVSGLTNKPNVSNLGPNYKQQELKLAATANKPKLKTPAPPAKPTVTVKQSSGGNRNRRGQGSRGSSGGKPRVPNFGATCPSSNAPKNKKILGIF